jgi:hypothetical protein
MSKETEQKSVESTISKKIATPTDGASYSPKVILTDPPQERPTQRDAMNMRVGNDSLPLRKDGTVRIDHILGTSRFAHKR